MSERFHTPLSTSCLGYGVSKGPSAIVDGTWRVVVEIRLRSFGLGRNLIPPSAKQAF